MPDSLISKANWWRTQVANLRYRAEVRRTREMGKQAYGSPEVGCSPALPDTSVPNGLQAARRAGSDPVLRDPESPRLLHSCRVRHEVNLRYRKMRLERYNLS